VSGLIQSVVIYALAIALIVGGFRLYKNSGQVTIDSGDRSMAPSYPPGTYKIDSSLAKLSDLKYGDVVAYWLSSKPSVYRVGRIVALEGDRVDAAEGAVKINGAASGRKLDRLDVSIAELRIPRGCLFVLAEASSAGTDSVALGPVPFAQILGKLAANE
jgi:signal peptidase I